MTFNLFNHLFLGKNYRSVLLTLLLSLFIYVVLATSGLILTIQNAVIYAAIGFLSFTISRQSIRSLIQQKKLDGVLALPFNSKKTMLAFLAANILYTIGTKSIFFIAIFSALTNAPLQSVVEIVLVGIFFNLLAVVFSLKKWPVKIIVLAVGLLLLVLAWFNQVGYLNTLLLVALLVGSLSVLLASPYQFLKLKTAATDAETTFHRQQGTLFNYFIKYLWLHKNYLANTGFLIVLAIGFPLFFADSGMGKFSLIALAALSINTPISILFSSNKNLLEKIKSLPNQLKKALVPYLCILLLFNTSINLIYLISLSFNGFQVDLSMIIFTLAIALFNSLGIVTLEWRYPLTNWQVESDLWHNPRKYYLPLVIAGLIVVFLMFSIVAYFFLIVGIIGLTVLLFTNS